MKVFAIGDLHLSTVVKKPMDIFGPGWENHFERIKTDWLQKVTPDDLVLIPGDISWGMHVHEAQPDIDVISQLPGKIIFTRGNHDYWWKSISAVRAMLGEGRYALQNDAIRFDGVVICGTRGWTVPEIEGKFKDADDEKIYKREVIRLELALQDFFTRLCEKYKVDYVVYGHLHGKNCRCKLYLEQNGIKYYLTSCDQVDCKLTLVCEV